METTSPPANIQVPPALQALRVIKPTPAAAYSMFDDIQTPGTYATEFTYKGCIYYVNPMSAALSDVEKNWAVSSSEDTQLPIELYLDEAKPTQEQALTIFNQRLELWESVLKECVVAWSVESDFPLSEDRLIHLNKLVKRKVAEFIINFSKFGIDEADFFRSNNPETS